jgi:hypothetical protein
MSVLIFETWIEGAALRNNGLASRPMLGAILSNAADEPCDIRFFLQTTFLPIA